MHLYYFLATISRAEILEQLQIYVQNPYRSVGLDEFPEYKFFRDPQTILDVWNFRYDTMWYYRLLRK